MPRWVPDPTTWRDADAYVVGGGESLLSFDWQTLRGKLVIGCNGLGLKHGPELIPITVVLDAAPGSWLHKVGLWRRGDPLPEHCGEEPTWTGEEYVRAGGRLVARFDHYEREQFEKTPANEWVSTVGSRHTHPSLAKWGEGGDLAGNNAGAAAINLALLLGARRVFLLGFDGGYTTQPNSHKLRCTRATKGVYGRFAKNLEALYAALPVQFPGREVVNVSDVSKIECFPRQSLAEHFEGVTCG